MDYLNRVIILFDMDCFYCQVEENLNCNIKGKPVAVVQSNDWKGGGIIAVNYAARDKGVTRHMRGDEAKEKCPEIELVKIPQVRGKSDLTKYREAGKRVADVLLTFTQHLERASVDEAYLDITEIVNNRLISCCDISVNNLKNTFVVGSTLEDFVTNINCNMIMKENDLRLAIGGIIAEEIREKIFQVTGYRCSAGIAHNKILAKLVCGLHKPNQQTILPHEAVEFLFKDMSLKKIKGLGGKFGQTIIDKLHVTNMGDILKFTLKDLSKIFDEKVGTLLYNLARGIDMDPVNTRLLGKSISCCKQFQGKSVLTTQNEVEHWLHELADELYERLERDLEENKRIAKQMTVSFSQHTILSQSQSTRSLPLPSYNLELIYKNALRIIEKNCQNQLGSFCIKYMGVGVSNFEPVRKEMGIKTFFTNMKERHSVSIQHKKDSDILEEISVPDITLNSLVDLSYLSSTQIEERQETNHVYFEEAYPDSINDQTFINTLSTDDSLNTSSSSLNKETIICKPPDGTERTVSFFSKYFDMPGRECSTSKVKLIESTDQDSSVSKCITQSPLSKSNETRETCNETEMIMTCSICNKLIPTEDFQEHKDFHFALDLVKEERHLYKSVEKSPTKNNNGSLINLKKKVMTVKSKSILGYLKSNSKEIDENFSKTCPECNKRVLIEEFDVHVDFHVAKKIRLEQNHSSPAARKMKSGKPQKGIIRFLKSS